MNIDVTASIIYILGKYSIIYYMRGITNIIEEAYAVKYPITSVIFNRKYNRARILFGIATI